MCTLFERVVHFLNDNEQMYEVDGHPYKAKVFYPLLRINKICWCFGSEG